MVCECVAQPMRFPEKLIDLIDKLITEDNLFTTRPDFILEAVRFAYGKLSEKYADLFKKTSDKSSPFRLYEGKEKDVMHMTGEILLSSYHEYGSDSVQVMLRLPKGLVENIEKNILNTGFCKNRADFVRLSIVYKISYIKELKDLWKTAESYNADLQKALHNAVIDTVLSNFKDQSMFDAAKTVIEKIDRNDS